MSVPIYVAQVTQTGQGEFDRSVYAENDWMPASCGVIDPLLDGLLKLPAPMVGDYIVVVEMDTSHCIRYFIPIKAELTALIPNAANIQLETTGNVELEGTQIVLGANATDFVALASMVLSELTKIQTAINTHTHPVTSAPGTTGITTTQYTPESVASTVVKSK